MLVVIAGEHIAGAAEAGLHFVGEKSTLCSLQSSRTRA